MNKNINSKCICTDGLSIKRNKNYQLIAVFPCEHILHQACFLKSNINMCPICKHQVKYYLTYKQIEQLAKNSKAYNQNYVDMSTQNDLSQYGSIDYLMIMPKIVPVLKLIYDITQIKCRQDIDNCIEKLFRLVNLKIEVHGMANNGNGKKVYICNHTNMLDAIVIYYVFRCGFLASYFLAELPGYDYLLEHLPIIMIKRGKDNNTVHKIKKFLDDNGSICLFPEGVMTYGKILSRFRTGAFHTGYPVQPLTLNYYPEIYDDHYLTFAQKILSQKKILVRIDVLEIEYPPFSSNKIETVRYKMAKQGGFALSRNSNRDIVDSK